MVATVHPLPVRRPSVSAAPRSAGDGMVVPFPLGLVRLPSESRAEWLLVRQAWLAARARARQGQRDEA